MSYARVDGDTSFSSNFFGFPASGSGEQTVDVLGVDLRHVWKDSGWYILAGIAEAEADISITDPGGGTIEASASSDAYVLGFGKYLGSTTALDIIIADAELGGSSNVNVAVSLSHIGQLNDGWQYGADVGVGFADSDNRAYNAQFSLYPNRDLAFGLGYTKTEDDDFFSSESDSLSGFASWFVNETTVIRANFSSGDGDAFGSEIDTDGFGIGVSVRF